MYSERDKYLEFARFIFQKAYNSVSENKSFSLLSFLLTISNALSVMVTMTAFSPNDDLIE